MKTTIILLLLTTLALAQPLDVIWDRSGNDPDSHFGMFSFSLGDQNDDGYADWGIWFMEGILLQPNLISQSWHPEMHTR
jgi:hypothetical protein